MTFSYKRLWIAVPAAVAAATAVIANAADPGERTSMPEWCSERNVNCVIPDGPPRRIAHPVTTMSPNGTPGATTAPNTTTTSGGSSAATSGSSGSLTAGVAKPPASSSRGFGSAAR